MSDPASVCDPATMFKLRLQRSQFLLGKNQIGIVLGGKRSHAFNLHFLGHHLGAQDSGGFNQGSCLTINLQNASGLFGLGHRIFGFG